MKRPDILDMWAEDVDSCHAECVDYDLRDSARYAKELEARIAAAEEWTFKPEMPMDLAELVRILRGEE